MDEDEAEEEDDDDLESIVYSSVLVMMRGREWERRTSAARDTIQQIIPVVYFGFSLSKNKNGPTMFLRGYTHIRF